MIFHDTPARIHDPGMHPLQGVEAATYVIGKEACVQAADRFGLLEPGATIGVDVETRGKEGHDRFKIKSVQIAVEPVPPFAYILVLDPRDPRQYALVCDILDRAGTLVIHNSVFDAHVLHVNGMLRIEDCNKIVDTIIYARLAKPDERAKHDLGACSAEYLGLRAENPLNRILKSQRMTLKTWFATKDLDVPAFRIMAASDPLRTLRLLPEVKAAALRALTENHPYANQGVSGADALYLRDREQVVNRPFLRRQCRGLRVDSDFIERYRKDNGPRIAALEERIKAEGIKPADSNSLVTWLDKHDLLPENYPRTDTGKLSGDATNLERLNHEMVDAFLDHKRFMKVNNDYLQKALDHQIDGRIRAGTNILAASTGRASMSGDSALHQWPEKARGAILAEEGESITAGDWSQIEVIIAAYAARDTEFIDKWETADRPDVHQIIADMRLGRPATSEERRLTKKAVFGPIYGEGDQKLADDMGVSIAEARAIKEAVFRVLPGTKSLCGKKGKLQNLAQQYQKIFTISGRIIPIPSGRWGVEVHKGVNYFVQGSGWDLLSEAVYECERRGLGNALYISMHDELAVESEAAEDVKKIMETPPERLSEICGRVPVLRTEFKKLGERWGK